MEQFVGLPFLSTSFPVTCFPAVQGPPPGRVNCRNSCWAKDAVVGAICLLWISNGIACGFERQGVDSKRLVVELCLTVWSDREESPTFPISSC